MGYDFFMEIPPTLAEGYIPQLPDRPDWFRFTTRAMGAIFDAMARAGALEEVTHWPDLPINSASEASNDTRSHCEKLLATESIVPGAVPHFKFMRNDGWLVTPAECEVIASRLHLSLETDPRSLYPREDMDLPAIEGWTKALREWIAFNRAASRHGGYRVG